MLSITIPLCLSGDTLATVSFVSIPDLGLDNLLDGVSSLAAIASLNPSFGLEVNGGFTGLELFDTLATVSFISIPDLG